MPAIVDPAVAGVVMTVEAAAGFLVAAMAYYYLELEEPAADVESHFGHHGWSELVHQLSEVFADPAVLRLSTVDRARRLRRSPRSPTRPRRGTRLRGR